MKNKENHSFSSEMIPGFRGNDSIDDLLTYLGVENSVALKSKKGNKNSKIKIRKGKLNNHDIVDHKSEKKGKITLDIVDKKNGDKINETKSITYDVISDCEETDINIEVKRGQDFTPKGNLSFQLNNLEPFCNYQSENEFTYFSKPLRLDEVNRNINSEITPKSKWMTKPIALDYISTAFQNSVIGKSNCNVISNNHYKNNDLGFTTPFKSNLESQNYWNVLKDKSQMSIKNKNEHKFSGSGVISDYLCPVCGVDFPELREFENHKITEEHHIKYLNKFYSCNRLQYLKSKNGIHLDVITSDPSIHHQVKDHKILVERKMISSSIDGQISDANSDDKKRFILRIENKSMEPCYLLGMYKLKEIRLIESGTEVKFSDHCNISERNKILLFLPQKTYDVECEIVNRPSGRDLHIPIMFEFQTIQQKIPETELKEKCKLFYVGITLEIKATVFSIPNYGDYVAGVVPDAKLREYNLLKKILELDQYYIPSWFQTLAYNNNPQDIRRRMNISPIVSHLNYENYFRTLLWLEELQQEVDIQFYTKIGVNLNFPQKDNETGLLLVEFFDSGLAENRPCLMKNDRVFVCLTEEAVKTKNPQWFEGIVHFVKNQSVALGFHQEKFAKKFDSKTKFNIDFTINRYNFRVCHRAVDLCNRNPNFKRLLFPPKKKRQFNLKDDYCYLPDIMLYDTKILKNYEQIQAIQYIVSRQFSSYPYIIFGPPGTGKTVTIVETIKQILHRYRDSHILACAPSNSAADVITEKLLEHFTNEHVFRMYSESRLKYLKNMPERLMSASNYDKGNNVVFYPSMDNIRYKRVIVCTFIAAAKIAAASFPDGHFTHVILDEAGHAMECEALIGIGGVLSKNGQVILAGDPHQLGPMVRNHLQVVAGGKLFPVTGLDTSLLERIMKCKFYSSENSGFDPKFVTKLVKNYRSHKDILHIPNKLFYNSELQACGADFIVNEFCDWPHLPKRGFPIIVHSVDGKDQMERQSPSYYNPQEVNEVISYLRKLLEDTEPEHIGIITPYRLQVEKLKSEVQKFGHEVSRNLKIGSVEDFQGEERKVIIISTVRASKRHLAKDELFKLGFLRNPKRFNVAITRAQCLLILICCTDVLLLDSNWKDLIDYAKSKGGYIGKPYRAPKESIDEIIARMGDLDIRPKVGDISLKQVVEVQSWKRRT